MRETNAKSIELLYYVADGEEGQVEFAVPELRIKKRLSIGGEILVPANASYLLRNNSRTTPAKVVAVVPV